MSVRTIPWWIIPRVVERAPSIPAVETTVVISMPISIATLITIPHFHPTGIFEVVVIHQRVASRLSVLDLRCSYLVAKRVDGYYLTAIAEVALPAFSTVATIVVVNTSVTARVVCVLWHSKVLFGFFHILLGRNKIHIVLRIHGKRHCSNQCKENQCLFHIFFSLYYYINN